MCRYTKFMIINGFTALSLHRDLGKRCSELCILLLNKADIDPCDSGGFGDDSCLEDAWDTVLMVGTRPRGLMSRY